MNTYRMTIYRLAAVPVAGLPLGLAAVVGGPSWVLCDRCGCSVDTELIHPDGHRAEDGDFLCADGWGRSGPSLSGGLRGE